MKFIWNEPIPHPDSIGKDNCLPFPNFFWENPIIGWLKYDGIFWGENDYKIEYNYCYHFFDIYVYDNPSNGEPRKTFRDYLKTTHLDWQEHETWKWQEKKQIQGSRFWIQAEDFPNTKRFNEG